MKLKVCGMKYYDNINAVGNLRPDYMGFIFYKNSSRFFDGNIPDISDSIKRVGVFVDEIEDQILAKIKTHDLEVVQLHGQESPELCRSLRSSNVEVIKVFSVKENFDFSMLNAYEDVCDYFLFDTKGKLPGGNGFTFNWDVLSNYTSTKPYFLSGGIGINETKKLKRFISSKASKHCYAIDVNSRFEIEPGLKDSKELEKFKNELQY